MRPSEFVELIADVRLPSVFNPYAEICPFHDLPDAATRRRQNLKATLEAAIELRVDGVWIARDLGYRGGRRTGVALTDEVNLPNLSLAYGRALPIARATKGPVVAERTAAVVWRMVQRLRKPVFTWNVFPLHPHEPNMPMTNRCHTSSERAATKPILVSLLELLQPSKVIAIGNDAELGLLDLGLSCIKVRHPSYGGVTDFQRGVAEAHGIVMPSDPEQTGVRLL